MIEITSAYLLSQGLSKTFPDRFWKKITKDGPIPAHAPELGPCWRWHGAKHPFGYGKIGTKGGDGTTILAHKAAWVLTFGPVPEGMSVLHKCDNGECSNPQHLYIGTQAQNVQDMWDRHPTAKAKLSESMRRARNHF